MEIKNTHREKINIIIAFAKGKTIQRALADGNWVDDRNPAFNFGIVRYRLKPKLLEGWCGVYSVPPRDHEAAYLFQTEAEARKACDKADKIIFVREVEQ